MTRICGLILAVLLVACPCFGATRLVYENFDDQAIDSHFTIYGNSWALMSPPQYNLTTAGRGGTGYCFASGTLATPYLCWDVNVPSPWPSNEMYCSWYMRYPTWVQNHTSENVKFFYPHWNNTTNAWEIARTAETTGYQCIYRSGSCVNNISNWFTLTGQNDTNWHHYEVYVNFSTGVCWFKFDGSTILSDTVGSLAGAMDYISIGSIDATNEPNDGYLSEFSRQFDDVEIWDGIPDEEPAPALPTISNVTISNGRVQ